MFRVCKHFCLSSGRCSPQEYYYRSVLCINSFNYSATFFFGVAAIRKTAFIGIFTEFNKTVCQLVLENNIISVGIKRGKSRRICNISAVFELIQLNMPSGMLASAKFFTYLISGKLQIREDMIKQRRFPNTGIAGKCRDLSL